MHTAKKLRAAALALVIAAMPSFALDSDAEGTNTLAEASQSSYRKEKREYKVKPANPENVLDFARAISMLSVETPISLKFDEEFGQRNNRWWTSQREHLTVWCLHQPTTGVPGFRHKPNWSSRMMYYRFGRPETLLWLAEALGEDTNKLARLADELSKEKRIDACNHLRREIPFDRIVELLKPKMAELEND